MTFNEARVRLAKISKGKYRSILFEVSEHEDGVCEVICSVYVDGYKWHQGRTFEEALTLLRGKMNVLECDDITEDDINRQAPGADTSYGGEDAQEPV